MKVIKQLRTVDEWNDFKASLPNDNEVVIFKRSPRCPISLSVEAGFDDWVAQLASDHLQIVKVDVVYDKPLSQHLSQELGISHESPQVLWLNTDGQVRFTASHRRITGQLLDRQLG